MTVHIEILNSGLEKDYESFLLKSPFTLLYASNKYRLLLKYFTKSEDCYFVAKNDRNEIVGILPSFLKYNELYGNTLNSLPFYGSHGGIIEFDNNMDVKTTLLQTFYEFAERKNCVSSTIITSPFEEDLEFYEEKGVYTFRDERIGQITALPLNSKVTNEELMKVFHSKTRNMIRKAQKNEITVGESDKEDALMFLAKTHIENINSIGGIPKPWQFFNLISKTFEYGIDYKIWVAYYQKNVAAALLLFYFNKTVEYFTPAIVDTYRSLQPMSLLIFEAMKDAVSCGYRWWNWGGTWLTQDGVYNFKSSWGTEDKPYYYYTQVLNENILNLSKEDILKEYPYFFIIPFNRLKI